MRGGNNVGDVVLVQSIDRESELGSEFSESLTDGLDGLADEVTEPPGKLRIGLAWGVTALFELYMSMCMRVCVCVDESMDR